MFEKYFLTKNEKNLKKRGQKLMFKNINFQRIYLKNSNVFHDNRFNI